MPKATDIVVKNGANVDKTFTLVSPSAGDGSMASWWLKEGNSMSAFPQFTAVADRRPTSRGLKMKIFVPSVYTDQSTGKQLLGSRAEMNISVAIPNDFPEACKDDFAAYATGIQNHPLVKAFIRDALSGT